MRCMYVRIQAGNQESLALVMIPMIEAGSENAGCIWNGLVSHDLKAKYESFVCTCRMYAESSFTIKECDFASVNYRFTSKYFQLMEESTHGSFFRCFLHQICADTADQTNDRSVKPLSDALTCNANLEAQGNFFTRECLSVRVALHQRLRISKRPPSTLNY